MSYKDTTYFIINEDGDITETAYSYNDAGYLTYGEWDIIISEEDYAKKFPKLYKEL